ncbi:MULTISPECIES: helix-turn-helix transcriptional regulator [Muribaculaceae]|uniref:S24 family peptidase n=1 Tax=Muribaculaceae TaxID=2005473 RepID=UPI0013701787|nr:MULTISPECIES: helix-turn-helix transcriptional regulator [Muribaculaceae]NBJ09241.1 helix-turn-helix transcriptional regulator [Alistipes sp. Z76]NCE71246.1 helix-turn-helix transcriptional regulator [Muribaculaceae bacterium M3]
MDKKSPEKERILTLISKLGISKATFFRRTGLSDSNFKGRNLYSKPGSNVMVKITTTFPNVSGEWLLTGEGPMFKRESDDMPYENQPLPPDSIPLIPAKAMAGFFTGEVVVDESECERIRIPGIKADFAIPVSGDSMTPLYQSGDMVICQFVNLSDMFFQWGKVYVINTNQGVLLKKVRPGSDKHFIKLISENSDYDPIDLPLADIYQIALVKGLVRLV